MPSGAEMTRLTGQIGIRLHGTTKLSQAIEGITHSEAHHVVIAISETDVISPEPHGAKIRPMSYFPEIVWSQFDYTDVQRADMAFMAEALENHPYNYAGFALIGVEKITGIRIPDRLARAVSWTDRMMCSQMADFLLRKVGISLFQAHSGMVSPADFEHYFRTMGWLSPDLAIIT